MHASRSSGEKITNCGECRVAVVGHKPSTAVYLLCDKIGVGGERENIKTVAGERERQRELSIAYHSTPVSRSVTRAKRPSCKATSRGIAAWTRPTSLASPLWNPIAQQALTLTRGQVLPLLEKCLRTAFMAEIRAHDASSFSFTAISSASEKPAGGAAREPPTADQRNRQSWLDRFATAAFKR